VGIRIDEGESKAEYKVSWKNEGELQMPAWLNSPHDFLVVLTDVKSKLGLESI